MKDKWDFQARPAWATRAPKTVQYLISILVPRIALYRVRAGPKDENLPTRCRCHLWEKRGTSDRTLV